ncbi:fatty acid desaturase [Actinomycetospora corticicola]|uniref:Alkane 1-monooxygenase n=1 Tax=Actinomycetospora corticicola TaxID=663602 RepID=A0A7Y9DSP6_9PSEU|nr:alkane 1-monooxygenase [Actinomycetospora corticicola]NYD34783.1 alkane 1-monooxygenase [Actinomycetospora corticicola]
MTIEQAREPIEQQEPWRDRRRYLWPLGTVMPALPIAAYGLVHWTGLSLFWWLGPIILFVVLPALDLLVGKTDDNPPESERARLEADKYYRWITFLFLPLQYASLVFSCWVWATQDLSLISDVGLALTMGVVSGIAINTAHELGHKREENERWLSKIALATSAYGHFYVEHNRGHHVRVATPEDPASSRLGENFWLSFLPRSVWGSLTSSWHLEKKRFARHDRSHWTWRNDILIAWAMTVVLFGVLIAVFGPAVIPWLLVQAFVGFSLLEVVNYLEHYGLKRQKRDDGRYERVDPRHSWNADHTVSNLLLYQLQRHSDHHANPVRRYQTLRHFEESPQLPSGYGTMIVVAVIPPLWRAIMDPKVRAHYDGDLELANVLPRKRARYGVKA